MQISEPGIYEFAIGARSQFVAIDQIQIVSATPIVSPVADRAESPSEVYTPTPPNQAPVAVDDAASTPEDMPVTVAVLSNDTDPDGDALTVSIDGAPTGGSASVDDQNRIVFTPTANFTGTATVGYAIADGKGGRDTATLEIAVGAVNDAPVAVADALPAEVEQGAEVRIALSTLLANDSDDDGDTLSITAVQGGVIDGDDVVLDTATAGTVSFSYTLSDGTDQVQAPAVDFTVTAPPPPPPPPVEVSLDLVFFDALNDQALEAIEDGAEITLSPEMLGNLTVEALTAPGNGVESIAFALDSGHRQVENSVPYALFGNSGQDFAGGPLAPGQHTLTVTAHSGNGATGTVLATETVSFTVAEEAPDLPPETMPAFDVALHATEGDQAQLAVL
ncbi:MAG: Ig-like domain-containing protein, partial [Pseudomonadota bacterium]